MKRKMVTAFLAVVTTVLIFALTACGNSTPPPGTTTTYDDPYVKSVDNVTQPNKTVYYEGEVFDPDGVTFDALWIIEGQEVLIPLSYGECETWTHRDEPLTTDVTKITFTIYGCSFDVDITVRELTGALRIDASALTGRAEKYNTESQINLTGVTVLHSPDGNTFSEIKSGYEIYDGDKLIPSEEWYGYVPGTEGEHTFTIKYLTLSASFTLDIVSVDSVITPYHVQAEDNAYIYDEFNVYSSYCATTGKTVYSGTSWAAWLEDESYVEPKTETTTKWTKTQTSNDYVVNDTYLTDNGLDPADFEDLATTYSYIKRGVSQGAEGSAVSNTESITGYFYKFDVTVPTDGNYDLFARVQTASTGRPIELFGINVNGEKQPDNGDELLYTSTSAEASDDTGEYYVSGYEGSLLRGNQRYTADDGTGTLDGPSWFNQYYWSTIKIATIKLNKGTNTIRLRPTGNAHINTDYFALEAAGTSTAASEPLVINERDSSGAVLSGDAAVTLEYGEKLSDITGIPEGEIFKHYTLLYARIYDYEDIYGYSAFYTEVPITEEDITSIDYSKTGEQTVTAVVKSPKQSNGTAGTSYTLTFKVIILEETA